MIGYGGELKGKNIPLLTSKDIADSLKISITKQLRCWLIGRFKSEYKSVIEKLESSKAEETEEKELIEQRMNIQIAIYEQYRSMNKEIRKIVNAAIKESMIEYISLKKTASGENYFKIGFKDTPPDLIFNFGDRKQLNILEIVNELLKTTRQTSRCGTAYSRSSKSRRTRPSSTTKS